MTKDDRIIARRMTHTLLKFTPWLFACAFCVFAGMRLHGIHDPGILDELVFSGVLWFPLLLLASYECGFCVWHRLVIAYDILMSLFARYALPAWADALLLFFGLFVCIVSYFRLKKCKTLATKTPPPTSI